MAVVMTGGGPGMVIAPGVGVVGGGQQYVAAGGGGGGDACGSCGTGTGFGVGCGTEVEHAVVPAYVGSGGNLAPETTYTYVGPGRGNFTHAYVQPGIFNYWWCSIPIALIWLLVAWYFYHQDCWFSCVVNHPTKSCTFWGDPHFWTFDNEAHNIAFKADAYPNGDFWMVRTSQVWIQGRYRPTTWLMKNMKNDRACTRAIGFSGPFMGKNANGQYNKFIIEAFKKATTSTTTDGQITYNGVPVLTVMNGPNYVNGPVTAKYHNLGHSVDPRRGGSEMHIVDVILPGVHAQVNRWEEYIDGKITMQMTDDLTGHCGDGNGNAEDDRDSAIDPQGAHKPLQGGPNGGRVIPSELIFEPTTFIVQHNFPPTPEGDLNDMLKGR